MKRTSVVLDEELLRQARQLTGMLTIRELVNEGLRELVRRRKQLAVLDLQRNIEWDGDLDAWRSDISA